VANLVGAVLARRIRVLYGIWACCLLSALGNLVSAALFTAVLNVRPAVPSEPAETT
jgi:hypothetical protein